MKKSYKSILEIIILEKLVKILYNQLIFYENICFEYN